MKDHGRAQETVVIGAMRPLVIDLCRLLLGCGRGAGAAMASPLWRGDLCSAARRLCGRAVIDESLRSTFSMRLSTAQR